MMEDKQIYATKTIPELVDIYNESVVKIEAAYKELNQVRDELSLAFSMDMETCLISADHRKWKPMAVKEIVLKELKRSAWKHVYDRLGVRKILSVKKMKEFDEKFHYQNKWEKDQLPEFTVANVFSVFDGLMNSANDFLTEAVKEVYEFLRPAAKINYQNLKTNEKNGKYAVGKKVIIRCLTTESYWAGRVADYWRNHVVAVDRVFHSLDGKGVQDGYQSELVDAINQRTEYGETEYFKFRSCKNGNLHLEFKRLDLLQRLNQIAGCDTELQG